MIECSFYGRLGADAETKSVNGRKVANFNVAVSKRLKRDGEWINETTWVRCAKWYDESARQPEYLLKGSMVIIKGEPRVSHWINKDGASGGALEVLVSRLDLLPSQNGGGNEPYNRTGGEVKPQPLTVIDNMTNDDMLF